MKKGFTLIELLVVVLIIGILSAVALPQYTKAVEKARLTEALIIGRHLKDAEELFFMENGRYTNSFEELGVDLPSGYSVTEGSYLHAPKYFHYKLLESIDRVLIVYTLKGYTTLSLTLRLASLGNRRSCCAYAIDNYRSEGLCKSLGANSIQSDTCKGTCKCWDLN